VTRSSGTRQSSPPSMGWLRVAYASSPYCSPSRAGLLTGRHPARVKITDYIPSYGKSGKLLPAEMRMELPLEETTMAEVLRGAGYATWHVGKWHLGDLGFYPQDQGFDVNVAGNHSGAPSSFFWPYGDDEGVAVVRPPARNHQGKGYHGTPVPGLRAGSGKGEHLCDRLTSEAIHLIEQRPTGRPFFLYLPFYDVHTPIMAKPELVAKYEAKAARLGLPSKSGVSTSTEDNRVHGGGATQLPENQVNPTYAAMVETMDANVGRLLARLDELGIADDTFVLFTSDNGGHSVTSNRPLRGCKGWLYEGGVRVPWIVRWPGVTAAGSVCDVPVANTDILPTRSNSTISPPIPAKRRTSPPGIPTPSRGCAGGCTPGGRRPTRTCPGSGPRRPNEPICEMLAPIRLGPVRLLAGGRPPAGRPLIGASSGRPMTIATSFRPHPTSCPRSTSTGPRVACRRSSRSPPCPSPPRSCSRVSAVRSPRGPHRDAVDKRR
jgi:hypothetical protein